MKVSKFFAFVVSGVPILAAVPLGYAPAPNDSYWADMWHLENRDSGAVPRLPGGIDLNARAAWSLTRGAGVTIAIVDDGVELAHPELAGRALPSAHWNFQTDTPSGEHPVDRFFHGTAVAGMAVAEGNNRRGMIGIAPESRFASWVIFRTNAQPGEPYVSPAQRAKMFGYLNQTVAVQNHSWVTPGNGLIAMSAEEDAAISNAVTLGRGGKGVAMVRAAGNSRIAPYPRNVNEDNYLSDPRVIVVAAIRADGRVASYSTPGAAILTGAPSGDDGSIRPFSTDRLGSKGYNSITFQTDHADYVFGSLWQGGTSSAAPLVSGVAALMLSINPGLSYRDVQQILALASEQTDPADPNVRANGAGLLVSHNTGYGLVNAGTAVDLARRWPSRPDLATRSWSAENPQEIPDAGLRVLLSGSDTLPPGAALAALPSLGLVPDDPTEKLPLVYVGQALPVTENLQGKGALIQRGGAPFSEKIENAARAGAAFAIVYNNQGTNRLEVMGSTDFSPIPAVFISQFDGERLAQLATNETIEAQLAVRAAQIIVPVSGALLCEQVSVTLDYTHEQRGDVRVTLVSPMGTRSVMQRLGDVTDPFAGSWTFTSTHHFFESSAGDWLVEVSDMVSGGTGAVTRATLEIRGVPIADSDADGLDDTWEQRHFSSLARGPKDDPDNDGYSNAREQLLNTNPALREIPLEANLADWGNGIVRLSWPSRAGQQYEVLAANDIGAAFTVIDTVPGAFPRTGWFGPRNGAYRFYRVRERP